MSELPDALPSVAAGGRLVLPALQEFWQHFARNRGAVGAGLIVLLLVFWWRSSRR